jgi:hypothetical protein
VSGECIDCRIKIHICQEREQANPPFKIKGQCVSALVYDGSARVTSISSGFHMISHIFHFLSFFVVGVAGLIGEAGTSSGASATAGSLGAIEDLERTNSPVASSIDVRVSSPGDLGDESQAPGNNRDDVEDSYRARGEVFVTLEGSTVVSRSNFGLMFTCEYSCGAIDTKGE